MPIFKREWHWISRKTVAIQKQTNKIKKNSVGMHIRNKSYKMFLSMVEKITNKYILSDGISHLYIGYEIPGQKG